ncbi:MAG: chemotaxis protein CheD [Gammaproteobacteria bacterium]|nr:MAG: chemotaxis protein CheD [Gammaproteobacteria bacterium]PIE36856.1 MAG: chemotaxis protein CheD [Gammaproteobacteria bacterium]
MTTAKASMQARSRLNHPERMVVLSGFESLSSWWDSQFRRHAVRVLPGEFYVTRGDEVVSTVLGSCVTACIRDADAGIGGINHFMLPERTDSDPLANCELDARARYGSCAMEQLIDTIVAHGGQHERLEVKLFGGAQVLPSGTEVGRRNIEFALAYLASGRLQLAGRDLGGVNPRRLLYFPATGRVLVKRLPVSEGNDVIREEASYLSRLEERLPAADSDFS